MAMNLNRTPFFPACGNPELSYPTLDGEPYACIRDVDAMPTFFMSVVSDSDLWLFAGSNGVFAAGRRDPDHGIFPYQTVDKILSHADSCGARTVFRVRQGGTTYLWEPWHESARTYRTARNLYKHVYGTHVVFEEVNETLGLTYRTTLSTCEEYGLVRRSVLLNHGGEVSDIDVLDGWHRMVTPGVDQAVFERYSYLVGAYMRHEFHAAERLGIYTLNSRLTDRPEPAECLRAACAWGVGQPDPTILLCDRQVEAFRRGESPEAEFEVRGEFGAYLAAFRVACSPGSRTEWWTVADTDLDHAALLRLKTELGDSARMRVRLEEAVSRNCRRLRARIAAADGLQVTADGTTGVHHFANALFNCMRGGTFVDGGRVPADDFRRFLEQRNTAVAARFRDRLRKLPATLALSDLRAAAERLGDPDLVRLAREYLPLTFSRRHGDPSRPWNHFCIRLRDDAGQPVYSYEGNWRDIFQNWESLALSFPEALESMVAIFLNASTADGYNPYRVTREGIDWEVAEPGNPWANIGYWGDHQIVYLLRLLEKLEQFRPGRLQAMLNEKTFVYVHVPYRIADFTDTVADPHATITFDHEAHGALLRRATALGGDGKLVTGPDGSPMRVSAAEKLLLPALVKLTNLVPGGGIWMNTQRPEWNDANNALTGWGLSVVTACYLKRYLEFCREFLGGQSEAVLDLSEPVAGLLGDLAGILGGTAAGIDSDSERYGVMESLGLAGQRHRHAVYALADAGLRSGNSAGDAATGSHRARTVPVPVGQVLDLLAVGADTVAATIRANRREDGLFHSYNVLEIPGPRRAAVRRLDLMLEGQVAVLSSGLLTPAEAAEMVAAMRRSPIFRPERHSYILYPDREIRGFLERNTLPADAETRAPLLRQLADAGDRSLVVADDAGRLHFQADLVNARALTRVLDALATNPEFRAGVDRDRAAIPALWEDVFSHRTFTGRSGTMFGFEGLGSIYWHMVAKLLLAIQENFRLADAADADPATVASLAAAYRDVRDGLGFRKSPSEWGAFPTDPYSHTPANRGAQQPGMTGQVKEEILTRFGELGVAVEGGCLHFRPRLLDRAEFAVAPGTFEYVAVDGTVREWNLPGGSLAFTVCQTPVCYRQGTSSGIVVTRCGGEQTSVPGHILPRAETEALLGRTGEIEHLTVTVSSLLTS